MYNLKSFIYLYLTIQNKKKAVVLFLFCRAVLFVFCNPYLVSARDFPARLSGSPDWRCFAKPEGYDPH